MVLYWILFFFVALGAKLILGVLTIYLLLPTDRRCSQCDEETLLIRPERLGRIAARASLGLLQWRWCPRCDWEGMSRRVGPEPPAPAPGPTGLSAPPRRRRVP